MECIGKIKINVFSSTLFSLWARRMQQSVEPSSRSTESLLCESHSHAPPSVSHFSTKAAQSFQSVVKCLASMRLNPVGM